MNLQTPDCLSISQDRLSNTVTLSFSFPSADDREIMFAYYNSLFRTKVDDQLLEVAKKDYERVEPEDKNKKEPEEDYCLTDQYESDDEEEEQEDDEDSNSESDTLGSLIKPIWPLKMTFVDQDGFVKKEKLGDYVSESPTDRAIDHIVICKDCRKKYKHLFDELVAKAKAEMLVESGQDDKKNED